MTGFCLAIIRIAWSDIRELVEQHALDGPQLPLGPLPLELGVLLGVREQEGVAELAGRLVRAADDVAVEGVGDVGDDEGERPRPARDEARQGGRAVAERLRGGEDPCRRLGVDAARAGERPRHRRRRDPRASATS